MNTNPVNLAVRFLLEIAMLIILALYGWHLSGTWTHYVWVIAFPSSAAALWGIFRIQNDPKPAPVEVPGIIRLLLELGLFTLATCALYNLGYPQLSWIMGIIVTLHYIVSYDRTLVMIKNEPYKGFTSDL
jgi:hypothetical protein